MKLLFITCLILSVQSKAASSNDTSETFPGLYNAVLHSEADSGYRWKHRAILYKTAGADMRRDTGALLADRMKLFWQQWKNEPVSVPGKKPVTLNEMMRIALQNRCGAFLLDLARWEVDLNLIDTSTRTTLLDYLEEIYRTDTNRDGPEWIREYKKILVGAGAKYFVELDFHMRIFAKKYERVRPPVHGMYAVRSKGKWGWIDESGRVVIPLKYASVNITNGKVFQVSHYGKDYFFIDSEGKSANPL